MEGIMKKSIFFIFVFVFTLTVSLFSDNRINNDKEAIKNTIVESYIEGVFIKGDAELIKKGFHENCSILIFRNGQLQKIDAKYYVDRFEQNPGAHITDKKVTYEFEDIKVSGYAALAVVKVFYDGKQKYTDYMNLYKFEDGWKIVIKTYYSHF